MKRNLKIGLALLSLHIFFRGGYDLFFLHTYSSADKSYEALGMIVFLLTILYEFPIILMQNFIQNIFSVDFNPVELNNAYLIFNYGFGSIFYFLLGFFILKKRNHLPKA